MMVVNFVWVQPDRSPFHSAPIVPYVSWCTEHRFAVFGARRADIEGFARHLESLGRARATIARRLCTVSCFYRYAEQDGLIAVSPPTGRHRRARRAPYPAPPARALQRGHSALSHGGTVRWCPRVGGGNFKLSSMPSAR